MRRHTLGSLLIAGLACTWGSIGIIVRELDMPALAIVWFRVALAAAAIALGALAARKLALFRLERRSVLWLGLILATHWGLYFAAIKETSVASAVLVTYSGPIFMALLAPLILRERVPPVTVGALAVSAAGIALITMSGGEGDAAVHATGVALALGAAVAYGFLVVLLKRLARGVDPITVVMYQSAVGALVLLPAALIGDYSLSAGDVGYLLLLGVGFTAGSGILYVTAVHWVPATTVGILSYMEPVSGALLAALLLGESLTAGIVVGGLAIVGAGVAVVSTSQATGAPVEEPVLT